MKLPVSCLAVSALVACSSSSDKDAGNSGGSAGSQTGGSGGAGKGGNGGNGASKGGSGGGGGGAMGGGGGTVVVDPNAPKAPGCQKFQAKVFDFQSTHPDFQPVIVGEGPNSQVTFVEKTLSATGNPQYIANPTASVKDAASFNQWFTPTEGVNKVVDVDLTGMKRSAVLYRFGADEAGWYPINKKAGAT